MKLKAVATILWLALSASALNAQTHLIMSMTLGPNQIGQVKTSQGITTRITFTEPVRDIICGDLYDAATGKGSFVLQRIDNDVFLKPVVPRGMSNLFVKTGEKGEHTFTFDLQIVQTDQANRVVNVIEGSGIRSEAESRDEAKKALEDAQKQAGELVRTAREEADRIVKQANQKASEIHAKALERGEELDRQAADRAGQMVEQRFLRAMIQGVREAKTIDSHVVAKKVSLVVDPRVLTFDAKSYLRYTIKNDGDNDFSFGALSLERRNGKGTFPVQSEVIQGRIENKLKPGEATIGLIVFDLTEVPAGDKLSLFIRGEDNTEIGRLNIQAIR
ncbi:MAG TPA: hypothetical protein VGL29_04915 [Blastocatellia bacterium]